jgi:glycosyltransferase involved in cell wall biosynthesis
MRLAWFTPWPPDPSGVAGRSAEIVPLLAARGHGVDVFVDESRLQGARRAPDAPPSPGEVRVQSAHDFLWRRHLGHYDLPVFQIGNSRLHEFIWPYLWRGAGLVVLHDARLHHARGRALLLRKRIEAYRAELAWAEPGLWPDLAELAIAGFGGSYFYQWPMTRTVVEAARLVAAHAPGAVDAIREAFPDRPVQHIALGEGMATPVAAADRLAIRTRLGIPSDGVLFGVFGGLSAERRLEQVLQAFHALRAHAASAHLLLVGAADRPDALDRTIREVGLGDAVSCLGRVDDREFDAAIAAADVALTLRWPSALELSGPWLRALAAGTPTVLIDLPHLSHLPTLDPRTWQLHPPAPFGHSAPHAVAIAIDILDEDHSLRQAMRRLTFDPDLRAALARAGRAYWEREHTIERMADDYEAALRRAIALPAPAPDLPAHLCPDPIAHADAIAAPFAVRGFSR